MNTSGMTIRRRKVTRYRRGLVNAARISLCAREAPIIIIAIGGVDGADGGQRAFHRVGQPPAGQTEEQRNQRGDHTGVDQLPEVDVAAAIEQHDAVGEHEKLNTSRNIESIATPSTP